MPTPRASIGIVVVVLSLLLTPSPSIAQNPPPGFTYETLVDGPLQSATAMAFLPDGRLLITERETGRIRQFRNGALDPAPWATIAVSSGGSFAEAGLLGIAVDPGFLNNRFVYVFYTAAQGGENRIARLEEVGGAGTNLTVLTPPGAIPAQAYHNSGAMVFGFDGTLFVATGDALSGGNAQLLSNWLGKVLRFEVPNLTIPADNPFAGSAVYSYGHRNQFGLAIHPATGGLYQTENGGALMDEVNHIVPGGNHGWPLVEGRELQQDPTLVDPLGWYQPTTAPTGTCFYDGEHYPLWLKHAWFFADYNQNKLRVLWLDGAGTTVVAETLFDQMNGSGYAVVNAPDGNLWYLSNDNGGYGADEIGRYVYAGESVPSLQASAVSNKSLGGSMTLCVHAQNGDVALPWLSLSRFAAPLPTAFGNLWVPGDALLPLLSLTADDRAYLGLSVPNHPAFLGSSLHAQAVVLDAAGVLTFTNPSSLVLRG